jgi:murein DD-endopeptidase MepM/ murein hydrolase activator NlpD
MAMGRRLLLVSVLACAVAATALGLIAPAAGQDIESEKQRVDARIASLRAEIEAGKQEEGVLTSQLAAVTDELRAAESAVAGAESSLARLESELARQRDRLERLTTLLREQTRRLVRLQAEHARAVKVLEQRVRDAYIHEPPDTLAFIVSASSFAEIVDNYEFVRRIGAQDRRIAREVKTAEEKAAAERRATARTRALTEATVSVISARTDEARAVRDRLAADRANLAAARSLKRTALTDVRESHDQHLAEVETLAAESATLAAAIQSAQSVQGGAAASSGSGAVSSSGFIWPVNGTVVSGFGMRWGRMHEGIDITASSGTPSWAVAPGTVIHAGWLGGYGNLVVVDHGSGLSTAYAHASSILVGVGQQVAQGETVALVGSTGNSSGPHLHFEVRVDGSAVDPMGYL